MSESYLWAGLVAPFGVSAILVFAVFVYVVQGLMLKDAPVREGTNKKRVKIHLIKLSIITIVTAAGKTINIFSRIKRLKERK